MGEAENQINDLEYKEAKNNKSEQQEAKRTKNQKKSGYVRNLRDNFKYYNIHIIGMPEGGESKRLKTYLKT